MIGARVRRVRRAGASGTGAGAPTAPRRRSAWDALGGRIPWLARPERVIVAAMWGAVALGAILRLARYGLNRSLWIDEAFIALNVIHRSLGHLMDPLSYFQGAPPGFLALEKASVSVLGGGEHALRLWPLLAGLASLPLFLVLARRLLDPVAALLAVAAFAVSGPLIDYATQVKPYEGDVLAAIVLLLAAWACIERGPSPPRLALLAVAGIASQWVSFAALIILPAILVAIAWPDAPARRWRRLAALGAVAASWAVSAALLWEVSLRHLVSLRISPTNPSGGYVPRGPLDVSWYANAIVSLFRTTIGVPRPLAGAGLLVLLVGVVALWRRGREAVVLLVMPIAMAVLAATVQAYGFGSRFSLFLVPSMLLLMAAGIRAMLPADRRAMAAGLIAVVMVVGGMVAIAYRSVTAPSHEEITPVLAYVAKHRRPGDTVFVDYWAQYAFAYYAPRYGFPTAPAVHTKAPAGGYAPALRSLPPGLLIGPYQGYFTRGLRGLDALRRAGRVWLIFSHERVGRRIDEETFYRIALNRLGRMRAQVQAPGAAAYLYVLRHPSPARG